MVIILTAYGEMSLRPASRHVQITFSVFARWAGAVFFDKFGLTHSMYVSQKSFSQK